MSIYSLSNIIIYMEIRSKFTRLYIIYYTPPIPLQAEESIVKNRSEVRVEYYYNIGIAG